MGARAIKLTAYSMVKVSIREKKKFLLSVLELVLKRYFSRVCPSQGQENDDPGAFFLAPKSDLSIERPVEN